MQMFWIHQSISKLGTDNMIRGISIERYFNFKGKDREGEVGWGGVGGGM